MKVFQYEIDIRDIFELAGLEHDIPEVLHTVEIPIKEIGKYYPATKYEPAEYPELECQVDVADLAAELLFVVPVKLGLDQEALFLRAAEEICEKFIAEKTRGYI